MKASFLFNILGIIAYNLRAVIEFTHIKKTNPNPTILISTLPLQTNARQLYSLALTRFAQFVSLPLRMYGMFGM